MSQVKLTNICKTYPGNVEAAKNVCLDIAKGEFVVLVGPSGCGKSTTLRMIAGLEDITSGTLELAGRVVNQVAPKDRDIAMVFQNYALYPHMTVRKNMSFGLERRRTPREEIKHRIQQAAEILGLADLLERKPGALSGGQRQRVALGRAIVRNPAAFLFDEPLSNLDAKLRGEMRAEIKQIHRQLGATTIYVTHDQEEAMTLGDRLVVMKDGVVQQTGSPNEIYDKPVNKFVASFVGTPPMNFLTKSKLCKNGETLGIRPDMLDVADDGQISGTITLVENLGDSYDITLLSEEGEKIIMRKPGRSNFVEGDSIHLKVDLGRCHHFH